MSQDVPPTIFIVDDDEAVRSAVRMLVLSFGWRVQAFGSGRDFLDRIGSEQPDCVLLDLNMPGMNGAEVQEQLHARHFEVPVILITGHRDVQLIARARAAGAGDLLNKPFQDEDLRLAIERILNPSH
jgi:FixJ family two-component response regulator